MKDKKNRDNELFVIDLGRYGQLLFKFKWFILGVAAICAGLAGLIVYSQPRVYQAFASLIVLEQKMKLNDFEHQNYFCADIDQDVEIIVASLKSNAIARRVMKVLDEKDFGKQGIPSDPVKFLETATRIVGPSKGTRMIKIFATSYSPHLSLRIVEEYIRGIEYFNDALDLNLSDDAVKVIDVPQLPEKPQPRDILIKVWKSGVISFIAACIVVVFFDLARRIKIKV